MDAVTAEVRLRSMTAAHVEPVLSAAEIGELVAAAQARGWDLRWAAREGWLRKAGKAADQFSFSDGELRFERQQTHAMCLEMADRYGGRRSGTVRTPAAHAATAVKTLRAV